MIVVSIIFKNIFPISCNLIIEIITEYKIANNIRQRREIIDNYFDYLEIAFNIHSEKSESNTTFVKSSLNPCDNCQIMVQCVCKGIFLRLVVGERS